MKKAVYSENNIINTKSEKGVYSINNIINT